MSMGMKPGGVGQGRVGQMQGLAYRVVDCVITGGLFEGRQAGQVVVLVAVHDGQHFADHENRDLIQAQ